LKQSIKNIPTLLFVVKSVALLLVISRKILCLAKHIPYATDYIQHYQQKSEPKLAAVTLCAKINENYGFSIKKEPDMFKQLLWCSVLIACIVVSPWYYAYSPLYTPITHAQALIHPAVGQQVTGLITFEKTAYGVHIVATCTGLTPGKHGIHIHEFGACNCPDIKCAGEHYNPTQAQHGSPLDTHQHVGDLGNIQADAQGNGHLAITVPFITLNGLESIIGRSVIIHAQEDDLVSQPSGNSGDRIGYGIIGIAPIPA
jgi:Cu-Zn family superoxide dismutase